MVLASKHFVSFVWDLHSEFLDRIVRSVEDDFEAWFQDMKRKAKKTKGDSYFDDGDAFEYAHEHYVRTNLKITLINSFFVACWASFEAQLMDVCEGVQKARECSASVEDLSGSATERAEKYCEKLGFEFPSHACEWREIDNYRKIRNEIVHGGGRYLPNQKRSQQKLIDYAKGKGIVWNRSMDSEHELWALELTLPYCEEVIDNFKWFMIRLADAWDKDQKLHQDQQI